MEKDPAREYLNSVLECRLEARRIRRKLDALESRATSITSQLSGMPRGGNSDRNAVLAALADATDEYYKRLAAAERRELEVAEFIDSIDNRSYRIILRLRYLDRKPWSKVLTTLNASGYSMNERWMFKLHGKALDAAREKYKEMTASDETGDP